ncbi:secreted RxLR effector protein 161-like [Primulina tabacum]|uniref:secreted RxLR effector protein 161-like n=1 Tax=Primulina tabacum TaxID=48773 RepID=UPI003F59F0A5
MEQAKQVITPIGAHIKLSAVQSPVTEDGINEMKIIPYANAVGSIMYGMVCTRPDLAYASSLVSRFMSNPGPEHWQAVKWILRYLKGSQDIGLTYTGRWSEREKVEGYVELDFASDQDRRKSQTSYVFTLYGNTISWKASLQPIVALSTTEAEYVAAIEAFKEALWIKGIVEEIEGMKAEASILCDSQWAVQLAKNPIHHERTIHIDVRLHFIRDVIESGKVNIKKVPTEDNHNDQEEIC